jgi:signal transduction histidine kinase
MNKFLAPFQRITDLPLSMFMLVILGIFTFCFIVLIPYTGLYIHPQDGHIVDIYVSNHAPLQVDDIIVNVGDVSFEEDYLKDATQPLFPSATKKGDIFPITLKQGEEELNLIWEIPGFNFNEFRGRLLNIWWLAYIFWIFGAIIELFIRPRDVKWWLLITINHLTGFWLLVGAYSSWHLFGASILLHAFTWLIVSLYLHLNWIFPEPLYSLPKSSGTLLYLVSSVFFISELFQLLPSSLFSLALVFALVLSFLIQIIRFMFRPRHRKKILMLAGFTLFASLPIILFLILSSFGEFPRIAPLALLSLLFIPIAYGYLIFRSQLGKLEIRANLFISSFAFLIIVGTLLIIAIYLTALLPTEISAFLDFVIPLLTAVLSIRYFPKFQKYIEKNILGITIDYEKLAQSFSNLIVANTTMPSLLRMLETDVFPSLLIRQYAFVQVENHHLHPLLMKQVTQAQLPEKEAISNLHELAGKFIPNLPPTDDWLRLILPLKLGDKTLGFFLLGSRDPDDIYHQQEIPNLQTIANQTAVALSNILRFEQLKQMYELGLDRYEDERKRLARDLHDSVLNELGNLRRNLGEQVSPNILASYEDVIQRLREIVNDIRSPMLMYGLAPAIKALAEDLMQKTGDTLKVIVDLQTSEDRLPENIEAHLFHIVKEACQNSVKHAQASCIKISGSIASESANLMIEDDGIGFDIGETSNLGNILATGHYGLVGIAERAHVIGAKLQIETKPHAKIQVVWGADKRAFI